MAVYKNDANLKALWSLDEASGTRYDYTANNNDLTDVNTVGRSTVDYQEGVASADFEDTNTEYLSITDAAQTGLAITGSISIGAWIKPESLTEDNGIAIISKYLTGPSNDRSYVLWLVKSTLYYPAFNLSADGDTPVSAKGATALSAGTWYHIVGVYNGTDMRVYLDGALDTNGSNNPKTYSSGIFDSIAPVILGQPGDIGYWIFDGLMDEAFIFDRALSADEVASIYSDGILDPILSVSVSSAITVTEAVNAETYYVPNAQVSASDSVTVSEDVLVGVMTPPPIAVVSSALGRSLRTGVRVRLYDQAGMAVAEISPQVDSVIWRLNGIGTAQFKLGYRDPACQRLWVMPGARVLFQFKNGLPDWGGVIEFPLKQDNNGVVIGACSGEKILDLRRTGKSVILENESPGALYQSLLEDVNATSATGISVGTIYAGGTQRTLEFHLQNVWERIQELSRLTGNDAAILPVAGAGILSFTANWYEKRGEDKSSQVLLAEDRNVQVGSLDWQGPVWNRITLAGEGSTWGEERMTVTDEDIDSQANYGFRENAEVQSGSVTEGTLTANVAALIEDYRQPKKRITLTAFDRAPGLFADYDIGDIVRVQAFSMWPEWALDDSFRVLAREWKPDNTCTLEVEAWA